MTLNINNNSADNILQRTNLAMVLCIYLVYVYVALQAGLFLRDYARSQYVYDESWEQGLRTECKAFKGCKSVSFERNIFFAETGPSFFQIFRPQVITAYQFDRNVVSRSAANDFAASLHAKNPNLYIKIN